MEVEVEAAQMTLSDLHVYRCLRIKSLPVHLGSLDCVVYECSVGQRQRTRDEVGFSYSGGE